MLQYMEGYKDREWGIMIQGRVSQHKEVYCNGEWGTAIQERV